MKKGWIMRRAAATAPNVPGGGTHLVSPRMRRLSHSRGAQGGSCHLSRRVCCCAEAAFPAIIRRMEAYESTSFQQRLDAIRDRIAAAATRTGRDPDAVRLVAVSKTFPPGAIDEALRRGVVTLDQLWEALALTPQRAGNKQRRWLLEDSRDVPWSPAERDLHRIYRGLDLSRRHRTNHRVDLPTRAAYIDLALPELRLGFEVDGYDHHSGPVEFRRDRTRDPELAELGWMVVRFDAIDVSDNADWVRDRLHGIIAGRAIDLGLT